jgi:hypothetical protein
MKTKPELKKFFLAQSRKTRKEKTAHTMILKIISEYLIILSLRLCVSYSLILNIHLLWDDATSR